MHVPDVLGRRCQWRQGRINAVARGPGGLLPGGVCAALVTAGGLNTDQQGRAGLAQHLGRGVPVGRELG